MRLRHYLNIRPGLQFSIIFIQLLGAPVLSSFISIHTYAFKIIEL